MNKNEKKLLEAALKQLDGCDGCTKSTRYFYHDDDPHIPAGKAIAVTTELVRAYMTVEIVSAKKPSYWYADKIGKLFDVYKHDVNRYVLKDDYDAKSALRFVNRDDCVVVGRFAR